VKCPECGNVKLSKMIGYEVQDVYDGVLFWICTECGTAFPRDHGFAREALRPSERERNRLSILHAAEYNERRKQDEAGG